MRFLLSATAAALLSAGPALAGSCYYVTSYFNPDMLRCEEAGQAPGLSMKKIFICCN